MFHVTTPIGQVEVTVVHQAPAYRYGLAEGLRDAGFPVREAESVDSVAGTRWEVCVLVLTDAERDGEKLARLREAGDGVVVVVLSEPSARSYRTVLEQGADGVLLQTASVRELVWTVKAALRGMTLLPRDIVMSLGETRGSAPAGVPLPREAAEWLDLIAHGASVAELALKAGYSERQMYRMMREVYRGMGARNRAEAIALAARWGILS